MMNGIEFYTIDSEVWFLTSDGKNERLDETQDEIIAMLIERMMECYPEAYKALSKFYAKSAMNVHYYRFLIARRFCKRATSASLTQPRLTAIRHSASRR